MRKILLIFILLIGCVALNSTTLSANNKTKTKIKELEIQANNIQKSLKLDDKTNTLIYNVLLHVKNRFDDLKLGTPNYDKLVNYIDEERQDMMKVILNANLYLEYDRIYSPIAKRVLQEYIDKNKYAPLLSIKESLDSGGHIEGIGYKESEETSEDE